MKRVLTQIPDKPAERPAAVETVPFIQKVELYDCQLALLGCHAIRRIDDPSFETRLVLPRGAPCSTIAAVVTFPV